MKLISLRKFRDSIATIEEPVEVARRNADGDIEVIGVWTPGVVKATSPRDGMLRDRGQTAQSKRDEILRRMNRGG